MCRPNAFIIGRRPEIDLLELIGELAAGALERAELLDGLQQQVNELSTLAQVSKTITEPHLFGRNAWR